MTTFIEKYQIIIIRIIVGVGLLLGLFLLVATLYKVKEYRFVGSGVGATNTITVSGKGEVNRAPDTAKITFTVTDLQKEVKSAQENVSKKIESITTELKALGIEEKYIKTDSYNSYPQYEYPQVSCLGIGCPPQGSAVLKGYQVSQAVTLSIKDLDSVESVLGLLGRNSVTDMSGPNFGFEDDKAVVREARDIAIGDAKIEAEKLAKALGVKLVRIVSFNEQNGPAPMYAQTNEMARSKDSSAATIPVGEQNVQTSVTLVYEIQ